MIELEIENKSIGFMIGFLHRSSHKFFTDLFKDIHLNHGNIFILKRLYKEDGLKQNQLCDNLHLDKAGIARNIQKLIDNGFITKISDPNDKRANRIYLTSKARTIENTFLDIFKSWSQKLTKNFTTEENEEANRLLRKMIYNLEENN